jgi:hypothetical protein
VHALTTEPGRPGRRRGTGRADRSGYGPVRGGARRGDEAQAALVATLRGPDDRIGVVEREAWPAPPGTRVLGGGDLVQMVFDGRRPTARRSAHRAARRRDARRWPRSRMPPSRGRGRATHRYGDYYGIRIGGGSRRWPASGCGCRVRRAQRRLDLARVPRAGARAALIRRVVRGFLERGDTPFLHCYAANVGAVALYEKLGFRVRSGMAFTILALA